LAPSPRNASQRPPGIEAKGFNALFTHRVRLSSTADIDSQLIGWLQLAYDRA
jgi:hypothetical protein